MPENQEWLRQLQAHHPDKPEFAYAFPFEDYVASFAVRTTEIERFLGKLVAYNFSELPMSLNSLCIRQGQAEFDSEGVFERYRGRDVVKMSPSTKAWYKVALDSPKSLELRSIDQSHQSIVISGGKAVIRGVTIGLENQKLTNQLALGYESQIFDLAISSTTQVWRQFQSLQLRIARNVGREPTVLGYSYNSFEK